MTARILSVENLALGYPGLRLAQDLSFAVAPGDALAVLGANGSGKSTFAKVLLGLVAPQAGVVAWPSGRPREIGYLAQMSEFDRCFPIRVRDLAAMGAWNGFGWRMGLNGPQRNRVANALEATGVDDIADLPLHMLSGGQVQRALFARVILQDAPLIVLDEPFSGVDQSTEAHLLTLIGRWREEGRAIVLVVHDLSCVLDRCSHALLLGNGSGTVGTVADVLTPEHLVAHGYLSAGQAEWMFRLRDNGCGQDACHG